MLDPLQRERKTFGVSSSLSGSIFAFSSFLIITYDVFISSLSLVSLSLSHTRTRTLSLSLKCTHKFALHICLSHFFHLFQFNFQQSHFSISSFVGPQCTFCPTSHSHSLQAFHTYTHTHTPTIASTHTHTRLVQPTHTHTLACFRLPCTHTHTRTRTPRTKRHQLVSYLSLSFPLSPKKSWIIFPLWNQTGPFFPLSHLLLSHRHSISLSLSPKDFLTSHLQAGVFFISIKAGWNKVFWIKHFVSEEFPRQIYLIMTFFQPKFFLPREPRFHFRGRSSDFDDSRLNSLKKQRLRLFRFPERSITGRFNGAPSACKRWSRIWPVAFSFERKHFQLGETV